MIRAPPMPPTPSLAVLFLTVFLDLLGFGLVIPLVQKYVEFYWGADSPYVYPIATGLSASYSFAQFLFAPLWGALSDRIGRRPIFLATIPLTAIAYLLFGLAADENVGLRVFGDGHLVVYAMFAARILGGIVSANLSTAFAYVADVTTPENRARGMGLIGAAFGLGFVLGPFVGGVLSHFGRGIPCYLAASLGVVNTVYAITRLPESLPPARRGHVRVSRWQALRDLVSMPHLGVLLVLYFLATFSFAHMEQSLALFLGLAEAKGGRGFTEREIGMSFGVIGLLGAIVQGGLIRHLAARYAERALVLAGWLLLGVGLVLTAEFGWGGRPLAVLVLAAVLVAFGQGIANPSLSSLVSRCAPAEAQGKVFGATQSVSSLARVVGPLSTGWVGYALGSSAPLYVAAGGTLLAFGVLALSGVRASGRPSGAAHG